jgi:hypothetical protein
MWRLGLVWSSITHKTCRVPNATEYFLLSACLTLLLVLVIPWSPSLVMAVHSKFLNHTMPESDEEVQRLVEEKTGIWPCLWQIKVVRMILEQWDVIEIAATGSRAVNTCCRSWCCIAIANSSRLCRLTSIHVGQSLIYCRGPQ